jgi:hypothetical protein
MRHIQYGSSVQYTFGKTNEKTRRSLKRSGVYLMRFGGRISGPSAILPAGT